MGCMMSAEQKQNRVVDEQLRRDGEELKKEVKLLLLGAGDSGKSTIVKQMIIIHEKGFSNEDRMRFKPVVHNNAIVSLQAILTALPTYNLSIPPALKEVGVRVARVNGLDLSESVITEALARDMQQLWALKGVQEAYQYGHLYHLTDSAKYYLDQLSRLSQPNYLPTDADILRTRSRTSGIAETKFCYKNLNFRMVDVGGQRSERKKWIHCFENVTAIIFTVALSSYDQPLYEDESKNQMHESMGLFDSICNSNWFEKTSVILFLNKTDVFRDRLKRSPLAVCFPEYKGGSSIQKGMEYVLGKFERLSKGRKTIYSHFTCATDTENIRFVFEVVTDIIIQDQLRYYRLV